MANIRNTLTDHAHDAELGIASCDRGALLRPFSIALWLFAMSCRAPATAPVEPTATDGQWSRVVVHASIEPPVGVRIAPGVALFAGTANYGGSLPEPAFERVDAFPIELRCRRSSMCGVVIRNRLGAVLFAFDPVVEVELLPSRDARQSAVVRYRDQESTSAALGQVHERSSALEWACLDTSVERARRRERAEPLERALRQIAAEERRGVVQRAAGLALVQGQCTGSAENRAIARQLLDALQPTAPELALWTDGLRNLGVLAEDPRRADALIDAVIEQHPRPAVGARLLFLRLTNLGEDADPRIREAILQRLDAPPFVDTAAAQLAEVVGRPRDAVRLQPGDRLPALELSHLDGGVIRTDDRSDRLLLLYFSASWCGGCIEALPRLRGLEDAHREVRIVYVLWDGQVDARDFRGRRGPIPGEVAWTDEHTRATLRSHVLKYVSLPSFVLADADGVVLATSDETKLAALDEVLTRQATTP